MCSRAILRFDLRVGKENITGDDRDMYSNPAPIPAKILYMDFLPFSAVILRRFGIRKEGFRTLHFFEYISDRRAPLPHNVRESILKNDNISRGCTDDGQYEI